MKSILRHIIMLSLLLLCIPHIYAETVSWKEATKIAELFFNAHNRQIMSKPNLVFNGKEFTTDRLFSPFYVFNHLKGGFVIIAAENKAMPILGYSLNSEFDPESLDSITRRLLSEYARDIEYIRYDGRQPDEAIKAWTDLPEFIDASLNRYSTSGFQSLQCDDSVRIMRNYATEFPDIGNPQTDKETRAENIPTPEPPISKLNFNEPKLRFIGGGHFELQLPDPVKLVRLYNLNGVLIRELTFRNTDTATFNLDSEPPGFYFVLVCDVNNRTYSYKIYK